MKETNTISIPSEFFIDMYVCVCVCAGCFAATRVASREVIG